MDPPNHPITISIVFSNTLNLETKMRNNDKAKVYITYARMKEPLTEVICTFFVFIIIISQSLLNFIYGVIQNQFSEICNSVVPFMADNAVPRCFMKHNSYDSNLLSLVLFMVICRCWPSKCFINLNSCTSTD